MYRLSTLTQVKSVLAADKAISKNVTFCTRSSSRQNSTQNVTFYMRSSSRHSNIQNVCMRSSSRQNNIQNVTFYTRRLINKLVKVQRVVKPDVVDWAQSTY